MSLLVYRLFFFYKIKITEAAVITPRTLLTTFESWPIVNFPITEPNIAHKDVQRGAIIEYVINIITIENIKPSPETEYKDVVVKVIK